MFLYVVCLKLGSLDVQTSNRRRGGQQEYKNLRKALCIGYANQLAERMIRHNGYRPLGFKSELVQVITVSQCYSVVFVHFCGG